MLKRADILSELNEISQIVENLPFSPVFTVPKGYFDRFHEILMQRIRKEGKQDISAELEEISPLLAGRLSKKMPFSLPEGYFSENILPPSLETPEARVVSMFPAKRTRLLYAAAAVAALIGIFSLLYRANDVQPSPAALVNISSELPRMKSSDLNNYLLNSPDDVQAEPLSLAGLAEVDFESLIDEVNDKDLSEFLTENPSLNIESMN